MYLTVDDRKTYAYTANRAFDASKPTVVFIHGAANDHSVWSLQSRYYAYHGWNALAVDLPGHGKSAGTALATIGDLAGWIAHLLDAVGAKHVTLVGHSMGSLVALETAARHPERIKRIAMIGSAVPIQVSEALLNTSKANDHAAYEMINVFAHSNTAQLGGNRVPGMWMMGSAMRLMERSGDGVLHADFSACNHYAAGLEAARKLKCPVLMILGKRDLMTPMKVARDVISKLPDVKVVALDGAGHSLMAEKPDEVLDSLISFLA
ncbi:MAG: alpha/beta hydrolase [Betaproteobacteria bacterium]|nr:alpha/beta hydrolase [Betaproteobacteria bacterium]